jgi:hypothetical protein
MSWAARSAWMPPLLTYSTPLTPQPTADHRRFEALTISGMEGCSCEPMDLRELCSKVDSRWW